MKMRLLPVWPVKIWVFLFVSLMVLLMTWTLFNRRIDRIDQQIEILHKN